MNKKKILSLIMALVMLVGVFSPLSALAAETTTTDTVTLHKILMDKKTFNAFTDKKEGTTTGKDGTEYVGDKITNVKDFFAGKNPEQSAVAKEIEGAYFALKFAADYKDTDKQGKYVKADVNDPLKPADPLVATENVKEAVGGKTGSGETGVVFKTAGLTGNFEIDEIHSMSTYKGEKGETLTDMKAVPTKITLPLVNNSGIVGNAHVYPKNIEDKPQIDKNFATNNTATEVDKYINDEKTNIGTSTNHPQTGDKKVEVGPKAGANYDNYQKEKARVTADIGKEIPYEVKTKIPKASKYKKLVWTDTMTNGLTFDSEKGVTITGLVGIGEEKNATEKALVEGTDYTLIKDDRGFELKLTKVGLEKLERAAATKDIEVTLTYSAKLNKDAVRDVPEKNDIALDYGNKPGKDSEPKEGKPSEGKITVNKSWDRDGDNQNTEADANAKVVYTLQVKDENNSWKNVKSVLVTSKDNFKYTFEGLDNGKTYRVIERVSGYDPQYTSFENGTVKITNKGDKDNPKPLNPTEPEVVNGGKKFVKTDNGTETAVVLKDAIFVVKKGDNYLAYKSNATSTEDAEAKKTAKEAYLKAIEEFNKMTKTQQEGQEGQAKQTEIDQKKEAYFNAFKADQNQYEWVSDKNEAIHLQSNDKGQFEITGLAYGEYELEEIKAPAGYAKLSGTKTFKVQKGKAADENIVYKNAALTEDDTNKFDSLRVENKKVSIPQTGGMGTVLFTVVGISLMAGAVIAMKRNREEA